MLRKLALNFIMEEQVTLLSFNLPAEMLVIKSKLESEGIKCFVNNELMIQSEDFSPQGFQELYKLDLRVSKNDFKKAQTIAKNAGFIVEDIDIESQLRWIEKPSSKIPVIKELPFKTRIVVLNLIFLSIILLTIIVYAVITQR